MKRILFPIMLVALFSCGQKSAQTPVAEKTDAAKDTASVDSTSTDSTQVDGTTSATARPNEVIFNGNIVLSPQRHATVSVPMGGVVKRTSLLPGQMVRKNTVVAVIQNPDFITLQQTYLDSHAQVEYLRTEYERQSTLASQQASSQKKSQQSKADYMSMKSKLQASAAQLSLYGITPATLLHKGIQPYLYVKAPISGYVSNVKTNIGKYMQEGDALCEVIDKSSPMLCLNSYEKDITKMRVGSTIEFRVAGLGGNTFRARIISISQNVNEESRSLEVYATILSNNAQFRPGMYVTARFTK